MSDSTIDDHFAEGLYPVHGLMNHSCQPNGMISNSGFVLQTRALKDVLKGDEITMSFVKINWPSTRRQRALMLRRGRLCTCESCIANGQVDDGGMEVGTSLGSSNTGWLTSTGAPNMFQLSLPDRM